MRRRILGILIGLGVGAALGVLCAFLLAPASPAESGWTSYPTLAEATMPKPPTLWQHVRSAPEFRFWVFLGLLWGGGFGAVTGPSPASATD